MEQQEYILFLLKEKKNENENSSRSKMGFVKKPFIFENDLGLEKNRTGFVVTEDPYVTLGIQTLFKYPTGHSDLPHTIAIS